MSTVVSGIVLDPSGIPYSNGQITAFSTTPGQYTASIGVDGTIQQPFILPAGTYTFVVSTPGIAPPLGTGKQQFAKSIAITGTTQDIGASLTASSLSLFNNASTLSAAAQGTVRKVDAEVTLGYPGSTTVSGSIVGVRGNITVGSGTTIIGSSYLYGVQGKITAKGSIANTGGNGIIACGILGQLDLSSAVAISSPMAAGWFDCGAAASAGAVTGEANIDGIVIYNNISTLTINSMIRSICKANYLLDLSSNSGSPMLINAAISGSSSMCLAVNVDGTPFYIPMYAAHA